MKLKKHLAIGGGIIICVGLLIAISLQFGEVPSSKDKLLEESSATTQMVVDPSISTSGSTEKNRDETKVVIQPNSDARPTVPKPASQ